MYKLQIEKANLEKEWNKVIKAVKKKINKLEEQGRHNYYKK